MAERLPVREVVTTLDPLLTPFITPFVGVPTCPLRLLQPPPDAASCAPQQDVRCCPAGVSPIFPARAPNQTHTHTPHTHWCPASRADLPATCALTSAATPPSAGAEGIKAPINEKASEIQASLLRSFAYTAAGSLTLGFLLGRLLPRGGGDGKGR